MAGLLDQNATARLIRLVAVIASVAIATGLSQNARADDFKIELNTVYGKAGTEALKLDVISPSTDHDSAPALVLIHGGGWQGGDKQDFTAFGKEAARHGYVCVTINYRHAPRFRFPAQIEDAKCAVRWLRANAEKLKVAPNRIGAVGASEGAHLAMMLGAMDLSDGLDGEGGNPEQPSKVQVVVSLFGPTNLVGKYSPVPSTIVKTFIGGTIKEKPDAYRQASPITYVNPGDAPMLLFQGTKDVLINYDQAVQMATALTNAGVPGRVELLVGANHGWGGEEMKRTVRDTIEFLDEYLKP